MTEISVIGGESVVCVYQTTPSRVLGPTNIRTIQVYTHRNGGVLGKATPQGNQNCDNGESHEAEKRPTEPDESTARHQGGMDD